MSRCETKARHGLLQAGLMMLLLAGSGCIQRGAPIDVVPGASPPPRAVNPWPQQPAYPVPPQVNPYQAPRAGTAPPYQPPQAQPSTPFPTIGTSDLPPPNTAPIVNNIGTPQAAPITPQPQPRPFRDVTDAPNTEFQPLDLPREPVAYVPPERVDREPVVPPQAEQAPDQLELPEQPARDPQPRASDDYATLLGDGDKTPDADFGSRSPDGGADTPAQQESRQRPPNAGGAGGSKALVALLVPESDRRGSVRALADGLAKAASLAASDFNESRLVLRKYDTGGDPRKAADAARKAIADGAQLIIGPLFSGSAAAVRPVAQSAGVSVIAFTTDESVLGGGLYSIGFLPQTEINRIISYASAKGRRNIAVLAPDSPYGGVITRQARAAASRNGATIVRVQPFEEDFKAMDVTATDFAQYYQSAPKVDALLMATNGRTLQGLSAYLAYRDVLPTKVKYMGLGLWDDKETFREATLRSGWFPGVDPALKIDFGYRFGQAYGGEPPSIAFLGYDAVAVAASLLRQSGGGNPFSRQAILSPSGYTGMSGLFRFLGDGRNERALSILEVGQGEFRVVDPAPSDFSRQVSSLVGG